MIILPLMAAQPPQIHSDSATTLDLHRFSQDMLVGVSRTFALSIPELPPPLDDWVSCAYLVCRMIDTLEDRPGLSESQRQKMFNQFMEVLGPPVDIELAGRCAAAFSNADPHDPCGVLMSRADRVMMMLASFPDGAIRAIRQCAAEMTTGLRRTPLPPKSESPRCLFNSIRQLERYCHYAAGVVGVMLTRLFVQHLGRDGHAVDRRTLHRGKRFGRGLQLTNIIKDHPADLADGRCFVPVDVAHQCGYRPEDLLQPSLPLKVRTAIVQRAAAHLDVALDYSLHIPAQAVGIRLFCVQPMMMALLTLERVITHPDPTPDDRPKITRAQVEEVIATSRSVAHDDAALRNWYTRLRSGLDRVVAGV